MKIKLLLALFLYLCMSGMEKVHAQTKPVISSFAPLTSAPGTSVTLTGSNFNPTAANNIVYFGDTRATVTAASTTSLTVTVPLGGTYAPISVLNTANGLIGSASRPFLSSFTPSTSALSASDFSAAGTINGSSSSLSSMTSVDLDNDSKPELISTDNTDKHIYIHPNTSTNGAISFGTVISIDLSAVLGSGNFKHITTGDVDGDGLPDIVASVAAGGSSKVFVLLNPGASGGFTSVTAQTFVTGSNPNGVALADIDSDGRLDVLTANMSTSSFSILRNTSSTAGTVTFDTNQDVAIGGSPVDIKTADLNNDGKPDVFLTSNTGPSLVVFQNTSTGGTISFDAPTSMATPGSITMVSAGDLDGDGLIDLMVGSGAANTLSIFRNTTSGATITFAARQNLAIGSRQYSTSVGDLNGDGKPDLLVSDYQAFFSPPSYRVSVLNNTSTSGTISFAAAFELDADWIPVIGRIVDLDGDSKPDIVSSHATNHNIILYRNVISPPPTISSFTPSAAAPGASVTLSGSFNVNVSKNIVYFGAVRGSVTASTGTSLVVNVPANATHSPISVLDTDSKLSGYSLKYFSPKFVPVRPSTLSTGDFTLAGHISSPAYGMASADLDDDGKPEIVTTANSPGDNKIYVRKNNSTAAAISFESAINNTAAGTDRLEGKPSIGDIDGDGRPDIVTPGHDTDNFVVMRNTGSLSGFAATVFAAGDKPTATGLGDFDGDGKIDVVVSNSGNQTISVFRNTSSPGSVSFAAAVTFTTLGSVTTLVVADFNGDGKPDILGTRSTFNLIRVFENSSVGATINFSASDITVMDFPSSLTAGDMDSDGDLDLLVTSGDNAVTNIGILTNTSAGGISFTFQQVDVGSNQSHAALADLNSDGKLDVLLGLKKDFGSFSYRLSVLTNITATGAITLSPRIELAALRTPTTVIAADMNGDGRPDLLSSNVQSASITVYQNTLQYPPAITTFSPAKAAPGASVILTGSGFNSTIANNIVYFGPVKAVVTAASANSLTVTVPFGATHSLISVLNTGTVMSGKSLSKFLPVFTPNKPTLRAADIAARERIMTLVGPYTVLAADFDGDSKPDLLTNDTNNEVQIHPNTSNSGTFGFGTSTNLAVNLGARYTTIGDVDGDGKLDIAVPNFTSDNVSIFRNSGSGTISFAPKVDIATGDGPVACAFADLNGDGRPELIVSNLNGNNISVFPNTTSGSTISFGSKVDITVGANPGPLSVNDFDGDGKLDVAVSLSTAGGVAVLRGTGSGSIAFETPLTLSAGVNPWAMQSGDIDGDGKADVAVTNMGSSIVTVFRNTSTSGTTSFSTGVSYPSGFTPRGLSLGDINGDGRPDMVLASESGSMRVYANSSTIGTVNFAPSITVNMPSAVPRAVVIADFDGDGRSDISVAEGNDNAISIFRNVLVAPPTVQASGVSFSSTTATSTTINWTSGNGDSRIVWMKAGNTGTPAPVDETTYMANAAFATGSQIGSTGWYAVYKGTGSSVSVTGLTAVTDYRVMVTEFNASAGLELYQTAAATNNPVLLATASTDATLSGLSLSSGSFSPAFASGTTSYSATVDPGTTSITVTSTANQGNATLEVRVNGASYAAVASSAASSALSLNNGTNTIDVMVTAQDGSTIKIYTITVLRQIDQAITFASTANIAYGTADFDPGATSSNTGIVITYASSDPAIATIVAGKVHIVKAGTVNITASQAGDGTYIAAPNKIQALTIQPKSITLALNASPAITKTYDGSNTATIAAGNFSLNGIKAGDVVTVSGTASFDTKDVGTGKTVTANNFVLTGTQKDNYSLSTTSSTTTGTITAKNITLNLNASPAIVKTYDGSPGTALVPGNYSLNGIETGDAVSVSGTASFDTKDAGTGKTVTVNTFVLAGLQKDNYSLSTTTATTTGNINPKSVTLSLNASPAIAKTYDGTTTVTLASGNYSLNGIETGDAVTVSGTALFDMKDAGTNKAVTANSLVLAGAQKDNYILSTTSASTTGSIIAKSITVSLSASPLVTKTYDGTSAATLAAGNYILSGITAGDEVTVSGTASFDNKNAGTLKTVTAGGLVLSGSQKDNYALSNTTAVTTGSITAKRLTLTLNPIPVITKPYDGTSALATLDAGNFTLSGVEPGDVVSVNGTASFNNQNAGTGKTVTANNFVLEGAQKDNYSLTTASATTTGVITARSITLSLNSSPAVNKTYDGTSGVSLAEANYTLNGIVTGDAVKVSGTASFDTRNAGSGKTITAGNFVLSGAQKDNYILSTSTAGTSGTIEKKTLIVRADDQSKRQGEANPVFTLSYLGFVSGEGTDDLSVLPTASSIASLSSGPGTYPITPGGGSSVNYNFTYLDGILTISPSAFVNTPPTLNAIPDRVVCYENAPQTITLSGITAGAGEISQNTTLAVSSANSSLFRSLTVVKNDNGGAVLTYIPADPAGGTARITVTVTDDGGTANGGTDTFSRSFDLIINSLLTAAISAEETTVSKGSTVNLTASGGTRYSWAAAEGIISGQNSAVLTVRPMQNTTYTVTVSSGPGCTSVQTITLNVVDDYKMVASNFLTPNGDGKNDTWVIRNIDAYPNNKVTVFDAAGRPVYQKNGYTNSQGWGGDLNGSLLTEGSYFYVIDFDGGSRVIKGFITILKDR